MISKLRSNIQWALLIAGVLLLAAQLSTHTAAAINAIPTPNPKPGSYGLEATKRQAPPNQAASISTPGDGSSFSTSPITVSGICVSGLLVQIYNNNVMVGSIMCVGGSFSLQVSLFAGINELTAIVYDDLEQAGPVSSIVRVNYTDTRFTAFGELVTLTSSYGRRSAAAGSQLEWPLQLSGGTGPYAFTIDWGDGSPVVLKSQSLSGLVMITHAYKRAGIYSVNIKVTDVNGVSAFLQTIAVANGKVDGAAALGTKPDKTTQTAKVLWVPAAVSMVLLLPTYWLGRRSQLVSLRNKMLKERNEYEQT